MVRRFARLRPGSTGLDPGYWTVPSDGMCLNTFLVLHAAADRRRILLGRIAPDPQWLEAGSLDADRIARIGDRWMLPASQLLLLESPDEAAHRIGVEQLGIELGPLPGPRVFSESWSRPGPPETDPHWDLHYVYELTGPDEAPRAPLWRELAYVPVGRTPRAAFARGHGDVLELAGVPPAP